MRKIEVSPSDAGKRLDRLLKSICPGMGAALTQKSIRLKKIKLNGRAAKADSRVEAGDTVELYVDEALFDAPRRADGLLSSFKVHLSVVYEDEHVLLIDKKPGLVVHPDEGEKVNTLITHVRAYLYQKGEFDSMDPAAFAPSPVNRIDRFTGGIVIVAKTRAALDVLNQKIRDRELGKFYLCAVHGQMRPPTGALEGYILKREGKRKVEVLNRPAPGAQHALTKYATLETRGALSLVKCELVTGRTHQIRAQFAAAGHPLLGDSQYGDKDKDAPYNRPYQALCAYRVAFDFKSDAGVLNYLKDRSFDVGGVPFVNRYFPDAPQ